LTIIFLYIEEKEKFMKVTKTYSIDESIYNVFDQLTTQKNINKSSFIEDHIKKFVVDNGFGYIDKIYCLRSDLNHTVTVVSQDNIYYQLSDGSKISKILFMQIFRELEAIDPNNFFNVPILNQLAEQIKKVDVSKMDYSNPRTEINVIQPAKELHSPEHEILHNTFPRTPDLRKQAFDLLLDILDDIESGEFKKNLTSFEIHKIMESVQEIDVKTPEYNFDVDYSELKYKVLSKLSDVYLGKL